MFVIPKSSRLYGGKSSLQNSIFALLPSVPWIKDARNEIGARLHGLRSPCCVFHSTKSRECPKRTANQSGRSGARRVREESSQASRSIESLYEIVYCPCLHLLHAAARRLCGPIADDGRRIRRQQGPGAEFAGSNQLHTEQQLALERPVLIWLRGKVRRSRQRRSSL